MIMMQILVLLLYFTWDAWNCIHSVYADTKYCPSYKSCSDTSLNSGIGYLYCQGFESCKSSYIWTYGQWDCLGASACLNASLIRSNTRSGTFCQGYISCAGAIEAKAGVTLECGGVFSCASVSNFSMNYNGTCYVDVYGAQSLSHTYFKSPSSYNALEETNIRTLEFDLSGSFVGYNSKIVSGNNNLNLKVRGYYAGYGLTVNCNSPTNSERNSCYVFCYGNACVNLTLICGNSEDYCFLTCYSDSCDLDSDTNYDSMVDVVNNLIHIYDSNYSILTSDKSNIIGTFADEDYISNKCSIKAYNETSIYRSSTIKINTTKNDATSIKDSSYHICCFGDSSCKYTTLDKDTSKYNDKNNITIFGNLYCYGHASCSSIEIVTDAIRPANIYVGGAYGLLNATNINFENMTLCQSGSACRNSILKNGKLLVCEGYSGCNNSTIIHVETIIGLGYLSLENARIVTNKNITTTIYLLGYDSGNNLIIEDDSDHIYYNGSSNVIIYCQNDACDNVETDLYCDHSDSIGVEQCGLVTLAPTDAPTYEPSEMPTVSPTRIPTEVPTNPTLNPTTSVNDTAYLTTKKNIIATDKTEISSLENLVNVFENATVMIAILLFILVLILTFLSFRYHKKPKPETKRYLLQLTETAQATGNLIDYSNNNNNNINTAAATVTSTEINEDEDGNVEDESMSGRQSIASLHSKRSNKNTFVNYVSGFGKNSNHLAISLIAFEVFDIYTDIAYAIELICRGNGYELLCNLFLFSIVITVVFNIVIVILFLRAEFRNNQLFTTWFYEHSGIITGFIVLCTLTDINLITTVFTSQLFGHSLFYSPISLNMVNMIQISSMVTIFIQHLPQLVVQIIVIFVKSSYYDSIVVATLLVSGIDIVYLAVKALVWIVLHVQTQKYY